VEETVQRPRSVWRGWLPSLTALLLMLAAWGVQLVGECHVSHLNLSRFGACEEVYQSLARDQYVVGRYLPFATAALVLEAAAFAAFLWACTRGRGWVLTTAVGFVWLASAAWHGILCLYLTVFGPF
jgi:hypothetical protein